MLKHVEATSVAPDGDGSVSVEFTAPLEFAELDPDPGKRHMWRLARAAMARVTGHADVTAWRIVGSVARPFPARYVEGGNA